MFTMRRRISRPRRCLPRIGQFVFVYVGSMEAAWTTRKRKLIRDFRFRLAEHENAHGKIFDLQCVLKRGVVTEPGGERRM